VKELSYFSVIFVLLSLILWSQESWNENIATTANCCVCVYCVVFQLGVEGTLP